MGPGGAQTLSLSYRLNPDSRCYRTQLRLRSLEDFADGLSLKARKTSRALHDGFAESAGQDMEWWFRKPARPPLDSEPPEVRWERAVTVENACGRALRPPGKVRKRSEARLRERSGNLIAIINTELIFSSGPVQSGEKPSETVPWLLLWASSATLPGKVGC